MNPGEVRDAVRARDGMCLKCGMTPEQSLAEFGRRLDVHRLDPNSQYTLEGCETRCKRCHGAEGVFPETVPVSIRGSLASIASERAAELVQRLSEYVNDAVRMRLESEGLWPPNGNGH